MAHQMQNLCAFSVLHSVEGAFGAASGGTTKLNIQDKFDHDKGQKSAISGRPLYWRLSIGFFAFSPVFVCNLARRAP